jgi:hypothetical protein
MFTGDITSSTSGSNEYQVDAFREENGAAREEWRFDAAFTEDARGISYLDGSDHFHSRAIRNISTCSYPYKVINIMIASQSPCSCSLNKEGRLLTLLLP